VLKGHEQARGLASAFDGRLECWADSRPRVEIVGASLSLLVNAGGAHADLESFRLRQGSIDAVQEAPKFLVRVSPHVEARAVCFLNALAKQRPVGWRGRTRGAPSWASHPRSLSAWSPIRAP